LQIRDLGRLIEERLGPAAFQIEVLPEARRFLLARGAAPEYGARELRRTLERHLAHPLAGLVARDGIPPEATVKVSVGAGGATLEFLCEVHRPAGRRPLRTDLRRADYLVLAEEASSGAAAPTLV
jgi:ATP-dependent Clp protease ATP-binding subunit ClpA